jgi:hypothetical protein
MRTVDMPCHAYKHKEVVVSSRVLLSCLFCLGPVWYLVRHYDLISRCGKGILV